MAKSFPLSLQNILNWLASSDTRTRLQGVTAIVNHYPAQAIDPLIACFDDPKPLVRRRAIAALEKLNHPRTGAALRVAVAHRLPIVREEAVRVLAVREGDAAADAIAPLLGDGWARVRSAAFQALQHLTRPKAAKLLHAIVGHRNPNVRVDVAKILAEVEGNASVNVLSALSRDQVENVRLAACRALSHLSTAKAAEVLLIYATSAKTLTWNEQCVLTLNTWEVGQVWSARYAYETLQIPNFYAEAEARLTQFFGSKKDYLFTLDERRQVLRIVQDVSCPNDVRLFAASLFAVWFHQKKELLEKEWTDLSNEGIKLLEQRYRLIFLKTICWYLTSNERALPFILSSLYDKDIQIPSISICVFRTYLPEKFVAQALAGLLYCFSLLSKNDTLSWDFIRETHVAFDLLRRQLSNETLYRLLEHDDEYLRDSAARMLIDRGATGIRLADVRARRR